MKYELQKVVLEAVIPLFLLLVIGLMKFLEVGMDWDFTHLGIYPLEKRGVFGIFAHPLVHASWRHLLANAFPLFFLSWCLYYFYQDIASLILITIWLLEGGLTFCIGHPGWHVGASGIIYGLAFFLFFSGLIRKHVPLIAVSLLVTFLYGGLVWNMFPHFAKASTSWEGHLSGAIAGTFCSLLFMQKGPQRIDPFADDVQEEECAAADESLTPAEETEEQQRDDDSILLLRNDKNTEINSENQG